MRNLLKEWKTRRAAKRWMQQPRVQRLQQFQALTESMTKDELRVWSMFPCGPALLEAARHNPQLFDGKFYRGRK